MGNNLGVAALPNGSSSRAFPTQIFLGFSLGKDSSPSQRTLALKFIEANVNTVAQRKIQLGDLGLLAANKDVSILPENSKTLAAINKSFNEQAIVYTREMPGIMRWLGLDPQGSKDDGKRFMQISFALRDLTNGYLSVEEAFKTITTTPTN